MMSKPGKSRPKYRTVLFRLTFLVGLLLSLLAGCGGNGIHRLPGLRGDCEDVRLRCVKRCEKKYQSSVGELEYCTQRCNWEYRTCTD